MAKVVIIGSGFAGCTTVKTLRSRGFSGEITVVSPKPELFFYPSLIWVPSGQRQEQDLRVDLSGFFVRQNVTHIIATVTGLDSADKRLVTDTGKVDYDALIIASGGRYIRKLPGIEHAHIACAGWDDVKSFTDKLNTLESGTLAFGFSGNPKEPSAMRGGPIFEFLFGTDTLLRQQGRRDKFKLVFFSPAPKPGKRMGEKAVERILNEVQNRGIEKHFGHKLKSFSHESVTTEGGQFSADAILFIPGMTGPAWAEASGLPLSEGGFFKADANCRVEGTEHIYVAGDAGSFPGPEWKPKQAHMADLQAECAAKNLMNKVVGHPENHTFKTELICIVDSHATGALVYRSGQRNITMKMPPLHWAKVFFEKYYLRPLKSS